MWNLFWRTAAGAIAAMMLCCGQEAVRGDLLDWTGNPQRGELVFRTVENRVIQCSFDDRTDFQRGEFQTAISLADKGQAIEVLPDAPLSPNCHARAVRLAPRRAIPVPRRPAEPVLSSFDLIGMRGDLTVAGVVLKMSPEALLLRTRSNERKVILLRPDTRYLGEGQRLEQRNLAPNTLVFIRAGKNIDDELEAYQIVWGEILEPILAPRSY